MMTPQTERTTTIPMMLRAWLRDWGGWLVLALIVWAIFHIIWLLAQWSGAGDEASVALIGDFISLPANLLALVLAVRAATYRALDRRIRRAWLLLAAGYTSFLLGNLMWFYYSAIAHIAPYPSLADLFYLGFYPLALWGLLSFPVSHQGSRQNWEFVLDVGTVLLGGGMVIWYFVMGPTALAAGEDWGIVALSLAYPVGDLIVIFGVAAVALRRPPESSRIALQILVLGFIANAIADLGYGYQTLQGTFTVTSWPYAAWTIAYVFMGVSAHYQHWRATHDDAQFAARPAAQGEVNWLPYAAVAIGYGLLLLASRDIWATPLGGTIIVAVLLTALVVARQVIAVRTARHASGALAGVLADLERANVDLEQRVQERTARLEQALATQEAQASALQESLAVQQQLNQTIAQLSVPIIPVRDDVLVVPLVGTIDAERVQVLLDAVLRNVERARARQVFLDVTGVAVIDTQVAGMLFHVATAVRLLGAETVLVGIRPEVAQTLVSLGADLSQMRTAASLQAGLEALNNQPDARWRRNGFHNQ